MNSKTKKHPMARKYKLRLFRAKLSGTTIDRYCAIMDRALAGRDVLEPLKEAKSRAGWALASAALLYWADVTKDKKLEQRIRAVKAPPEPPVKPAVIDVATRDRILARLRGLDSAKAAAICLLARSGLHVGIFLDLSRRELEQMTKDKQAEGIDLDSHCIRCIRNLLATGTWKHVHEVWSTTGRLAAYAFLRRVWQDACEAVGTVPVPPLEDLRRLRQTEAETAKQTAAKPEVVQAPVPPASPESTSAGKSI